MTEGERGYDCRELRHEIERWPAIVSDVVGLDEELLARRRQRPVEDGIGQVVSARNTSKEIEEKGRGNSPRSNNSHLKMIGIMNLP